mmetsp:Transcript_29251/g.44190  ORF Transcript_29251/g.44190 Transcript_29251/m.44190 type:complete len:237 (-) Transcript_29251:115-825(-)
MFAFPVVHQHDEVLVGRRHQWQQGFGNELAHPGCEVRRAHQLGQLVEPRPGRSIPVRVLSHPSVHMLDGDVHTQQCSHSFVQGQNQQVDGLVESIFFCDLPSSEVEEFPAQSQLQSSLILDLTWQIFQPPHQEELHVESCLRFQGVSGIVWLVEDEHPRAVEEISECLNAHQQVKRRSKSGIQLVCINLIDCSIQWKQSCCVWICSCIDAFGNPLQCELAVILEQERHGSLSIGNH